MEHFGLELYGVGSSAYLRSKDVNVADSIREARREKDDEGIIAPERAGVRC
jgi:hypothetical protein